MHGVLRMKRPRILLVENVGAQRSALSDLLRDNGFAVIAANGPAGLDLIERKRFDLLICDLHLAESDALAVIKIARSRGLRSVAVARAFATLDAYDACRLGAESVWALPLDTKSFLAYISTIAPAYVPEAKERDDRRTVLLVDDNDETRAVMKRTLDEAGFRTLEADRATLGIRTAMSRPVDAIVLDILMPGIDGLTACRILKENAPTAKVPVLMCTVLSGDHHQLQAIAAAADAYLVKPFRPDELVARVSKLLEKRAAV